MALTILPGASLVLFLMNPGSGLAVHAVSPADFLDGLEVANRVLSFSAVQTEEPNLDELLPWCGNV